MIRSQLNFRCNGLKLKKEEKETYPIFLELIPPSSSVEVTVGPSENHLAKSRLVIESATWVISFFWFVRFVVVVFLAPNSLRASSLFGQPREDIARILREQNY